MKRAGAHRRNPGHKEVDQRRANGHGMPALRWAGRLCSVLLFCCCVPNAWADWHVVSEDSDYPTDDLIVAFCSVTDPGYQLPSDTSNNDCTAAIQDALYDASAAGGGTVFIPAGEYRIDGSLTIEDNVTLRGRWREITADTPAAGTILALHTTEGSSSVLLAGTGSGVRDLTFWHPGQDADNITANSPFVIKGTSGQVTIQNITLVNAYNGIDMSTSSMCCLQDIFGSPLKLGLTADKSYAVSRYTGIHFSPDYWAWSGLPGAPSTNGAHKTFMRDSGIGINIKEMDGFYLLFSTISGYAKGLLFQDGASGDNPWGTIAYTDVSDCAIAVHIESAKTIGMIKCLFEGSVNALLTHVGAALNACTIAADDKAIKSLGQSATLINCTRSGGVDLNGGTLTEESYTNSIPEFNAVYDRVRKPLRTELFNIMSYGAVGDGSHDDTSAIQDAIDDAYLNGGGVVFVPNGQYIVTQSLALTPGVELRGSSGGRHIASGKSGQQLGSVILIDDVGKGDTNAPPFLALDDYCGVRGIAFHYVNQDFRAFIPYPFMIQANGMKNYIIDCFASNPYQAAELNGDDHLVEYTFFGGLRRTYRANNCSGGRIQNCHIKPDFWRDYWIGNNNPKSDLGQLKWNVGKELEVFYLNGCSNYSISSIFNHASHAFFTADNSSGQTLCIGGEQLQKGYTFKNGAGEFDHISASCNINNIGDGSGMYGVKTFDGFSGQARFYESGVQGAPKESWAAEGGELYIQRGGASGPSDRGAVGLFCGPNGKMDLESFSSNIYLGFENRGLVTMRDAAFAKGFVSSVASEYAAGNSFDSSCILADLNAYPAVTYGLSLDTSNIRIVEALIFPGLTAAEDSDDARRVRAARLTGGNYCLDVRDSHFTDGSNPNVDFSSYWYVDTDCTITIIYHSTSGMKSGTSISYSGASAPGWKWINFSVSDAQFGSDTDIEIEISGASPGLAMLAVISDRLPATKDAALLGPPNGLSATALDGSVSLDWADSSEYDLAGYTVYRKLSSGTNYVAIASAISDSDYSDTDVTNGVIYYYVVTATDYAGLESDPGAVVASAEIMLSDLLVLHLDAMQTASIIVDEFDVVTQWINQSGSSNQAVSGLGQILYPAPNPLASGIAGLDFGDGQNSLQLFGAAETDEWLDQTSGNGFSLLLAFRCDSLNTDNWNDLIGNSTAIGSGFGLRYSNSGKYQVYLGGAVLNGSAEQAVQAGDTLIFAFNYDPGKGSYDFWDSKNNTVVSKSVAPADFSNGSGVTLGSCGATGRYIRGSVGEVRVYNRNLSERQFISERDALTVKWTDASPGYDVWAGFWGSDLEGADNDYDGDGLANLGEYALGGDPVNSANRGEAFTFTQGDGALMLVHPQRNDPTLAYTLESCTNLISGAWTNADYTVIGTNVTGSSLDYVTHLIPVRHDQSFIRLKVEN